MFLTDCIYTYIAISHTKDHFWIVQRISTFGFLCFVDHWSEPLLFLQVVVQDETGLAYYYANFSAIQYIDIN